MSLRSFFKRKPPIPDASGESKKVDIPKGLWTKCPSCSGVTHNRALEENLSVCPSCGYHFRIRPGRRLEIMADAGSFEECDDGVATVNPLGFPGYGERVEAEVKKVAAASSGTDAPGEGEAARPAPVTEREAVVTGTCSIDGVRVSVAVMNFFFLGGSMGSTVGERITRAAERALDTGTPLVVVSASGGARMHEGALSLMQMAKVSGALHRLDRARVPFVSLLTDPTYGGVTASFAALGDLILAEPGALIGFAGPNVIKETIRQDLPKGFQTAEFLMEHGLIDAIVPRKDQRAALGRYLRYMGAV